MQLPDHKTVDTLTFSLFKPQNCSLFRACDHLVPPLWHIPPPRPRLKLNLCPVNATLLIACEVSTTLLASREAQRKMLKAQERSSWYLSSVFSDFLYLFFLPNNSISLSNAHIQKPEMIMNVFVCIQAVYQNVKN